MPKNVNEWFGLTYSSWLTIPRVLLQDMPEDWQERFVKLMEEYEDHFQNQPNIGTTVRITDERKKLIKTPEWILNYKYPDEDMLKELKGDKYV